MFLYNKTLLWQGDINVNCFCNAAGRKAMKRTANIPENWESVVPQPCSGGAFPSPQSMSWSCPYNKDQSVWVLSHLSSGLKLGFTTIPLKNIQTGNLVISSLLHGQFNPLGTDFTKWWIADELFECVWPFCGIGA